MGVNNRGGPDWPGRSKEDSMNYHIQESNIKCPHCDRDCENDGVVEELETREEFECEHCGTKFWAEASVAYSSYSDCSLNNKEHEWENLTEKYPEVFNCKNCYQHEVRKP